MSRQDFEDMLFNHLNHRKDIPTGFSSWAAHLSLRMEFCEVNPESAHISVIDIKKLGDSVQIFYVPDLSFLGNTKRSSGEYLVHGIVHRDFHRPLPYNDFVHSRLSFWSLPLFKRLSPNFQPITRDFIRNCRRLGERYGPKFSLAVCLAILAEFIAKSNLLSDLGYKIERRDMIEQELGNCAIGGAWYEDENIMKDIVANIDHCEVKEFIHFLRDFAEHHQQREAKRQRLIDTERLSRDEMKVTNEFQDNHYPPEVDADKILHKMHGNMKVTKAKRQNASTKASSKLAG